MTGTDPLVVTWIGHATVLVEIDGVRILTDPALTASVAHLRRRRPAPTLDDVDVVAISHLHMDHLHRPSLRQIARDKPAVLLPTGSASLLSGLRLTDVREMRPGDSVEVAKRGGVVRIDALHAEHSGARGPHSRLSAHAMGYVFRSKNRSVYFAGDTDIFDAMADVGPVDVALVPVWGWGPTLGERHLNPITAARATALLQPTHVIPIHWGTYSPVRARRGNPSWLDDPLHAFRDALDDHGLGNRLIELWPGDSTTIP